MIVESSGSHLRGESELTGPYTDREAEFRLCNRIGEADRSYLATAFNWLP